MRAYVRQHQPTDVDKVAKGIGGIIVDNSASLPARSSSETIDQTKWIANLGNFFELMERFNFMNNLNVQTTVTVQTVSTLVKLGPSA